MEKSIGFEKIRTAIFISGTGSNFKNLIKFSKRKKSPIKIILVISNNVAAKGLRYASKNKIKKKIFKFKNKKGDEKLILKYLNRNKIKLICLAGFMKILSKNFLRKYNGPILNIHPSLLPKYKGLNTHERVLRNKDKFSGCSVHFVNSKLDSGKIIKQKKVKILKNDTPKTLANRILKAEHVLYPQAINKIFTNH